jgi:hypothetical protein
MRIVLFAPKPFGQISKAEKLRTEKSRASFFHCVLHWLTHGYMSNAMLRERFLLAPKEYPVVSAAIAMSAKRGLSDRAYHGQGKRNAR